MKVFEAGLDIGHVYRRTNDILQLIFYSPYQPYKSCRSYQPFYQKHFGHVYVLARTSPGDAAVEGVTLYCCRCCCAAVVIAAERVGLHDETTLRLELPQRP